jgi:DNA polymerase
MSLDIREEFAETLDAIPDDLFDRSRFVGGVDPADADVVFVGEAPGANEVEQGEPFVGNAGRVLDSLLEAAGIEREQVYITNLVKVRPPENRDPTSDEIDAWRPLLWAEIEQIDPEVVVPLGAFASREVVERDETISDLRGETYERDGYVVVPTYHPAATFYDDSVKAALQEDLATVAELAGRRREKSE